MLYFCIVSTGDIPIYEAELTSSGKKEDLSQFIVHAALDIVDQKEFISNVMFLKEVDKFNDLSVSAFSTAGYVRFLLLHDQKLDENAIKNFFYDSYELYIKTLLNPFQEKTAPIKSLTFDNILKGYVKKYLK